MLFRSLSVMQRCLTSSLSLALSLSLSLSLFLITHPPDQPSLAPFLYQFPTRKPRRCLIQAGPRTYFAGTGHPPTRGDALLPHGSLGPCRCVEERGISYEPPSRAVFGRQTTGVTLNQDTDLSRSSDSDSVPASRAGHSELVRDETPRSRPGRKLIREPTP